MRRIPLWLSYVMLFVLFTWVTFVVLENASSTESLAVNRKELTYGDLGQNCPFPLLGAQAGNSSCQFYQGLNV